MELSTEQIAEFQEQGFLIVRGLFDRQRDLAPVIAEYEGVLDTLAHELFARGEIKSTYADLPFSERRGREGIPRRCPRVAALARCRHHHER